MATHDVTTTLTAQERALLRLFQRMTPDARLNYQKAAKQFLTNQSEAQHG